MDFTRVTSPPSIRVHEHNANNGRRRSISRSAAMPSSRAPVPLAIPNARYDLAPPPLPPPPHIHDITAGSDPGWAWGNDPKGGNFGKARESVRPMSNFPKSWGKTMEEDWPLDRPDFRRRESSTSTVRSPADTSRGLDFARHQDEGYYSLSGARPSAMSQQLHGERQLQQKNLENSSQAYDNKLLSKIGKPKTPPRNPSLGSIESSPTSNLSFHQQLSGRHPNQLWSLSFPHSSYSNSAYSDPPIKKEPLTGYGDSPRSRPVSPGLNSSATSANSLMDWRSPPSSAHDSDQYPHYPQRFPSSTSVLRQQKSRRSTSGSLLSSYDESAANSLNNTANTISERPSPLKRESYDHTNFFEPDSADSTFPMEDSVRKLRLEDHSSLIGSNNNSNTDSRLQYYRHSNPSLHTSRSRPGMKRKPSQSPPPDPAHEANASFAAGGGNNTDLFPRNSSTPQHPSHRVSPVGRQFAQNQGSFSSQSSAGPRNNSYASSAGLSVASSVTTLDQHSPGISPSSEYQQHSSQDSPYVTSLPVNQGPRNTRSQQQYPPAPLEHLSTPPIDQKPQNIQSQRKNNAPPNMQPATFICGCCPKKPKKFDTVEELRVHESEKQYSCQYCPNRFKNKNEAERHQNSLHLRKHSWSCATLNGSFDSAFYPSTNIPPADNSPSQSQAPPPSNSVTAFDTCGYCGAQFPNEPAPDWEARGAHLNGVHKFGECNQSKKFFRADHFRQHLKHSHAGTSGKWTNMLETACMRDEPPPTPQDNNIPQSHGAPVANMGMGPTNMGQGNMGQANMGQDMGQNLGQVGMGQGPMGQANMGQVNMGQDGMGQSDMGEGSMAQNVVQPKYEQLDMTNIDPSIGMQQMGGLGPMANMGTMEAAGRGMALPGGQIRSERIDEMPQEM